MAKAKMLSVHVILCLSLVMLLTQPSVVTAARLLRHAAEETLELRSHPSRDVLQGCTGASTKLPADQCEAWQAFWDGLSDPSPCSVDCTRNDPCACRGYLGSNCNSLGTSIVNIGFGDCKPKLTGTLSPKIGAFIDIEYFDIRGSNLSGTVPASVSNWSKIKCMFLNGNRFSGVLPEMSFSTMTGCHYSYCCSLPESTFDCPWPAGATDVCLNDELHRITDDDCKCKPVNNCGQWNQTGIISCGRNITELNVCAACNLPWLTPGPSMQNICDACVATPSPQGCAAPTPAPQFYGCENNICVPSAAGAPKATCEQVCGRTTLEQSGELS